MKMTREERKVLEEMIDLKKVPPRTFVGRGQIVARCVRRGWLDWERANPSTTRATALFITDKGREAIQQSSTE